MFKKSLSLFISFLLLTSISSEIDAAFVTIQSDGYTTISVLASETGQIDIQKPESLDINKVADSRALKSSVISLSKDADKVNLKVSTDEGDKNLDVSNWKEDLIEIEERPQTQKVRIQLVDGKFTLKQKGVVASTDKTILIDSKMAELSVKTDSGNKFLAMLPYEVVQALLRTKVVNEVSQDKLEITENEGELAYKIEGNKVINFFNVYSYKIPVTSFVSATSGEILKVESPTIYKYVTFLFV